MAQKAAPSPPRREFQFIDIQTGFLTEYGMSFLEGLWRQIAAGYVIVPCSFAMAANVITLIPTLNEEGAAAYGTGMGFWCLANATSTGNVTANVRKRSGAALATVQVLKDNGSTVATTGDIVSGKGYLLIMDEALDGGAGAFIIK